MAPKEKMVAKEILNQLTNNEITPDDALDSLWSLLDNDETEAFYDWGLVDDDYIQSCVDDHSDDFRWLRNFLESLKPEQRWHYICYSAHSAPFVHDYAGRNGIGFKATVIDFIKEYTED